MKIVYVVNARIPTEKAHGLQIVKTCEALAFLGQEVILVLPKRKNPIEDKIFDFYQIENNFKIVKLKCFDLVSFGRLGFLLQSLSFGINALFFTWSWPAEVFFSRDEIIIFLLGIKKRKLFWEVHNGRTNWMVRKIIPKLIGMIAITSGLKEYYQERGLPAEKILVVPDAVDLEKFSIPVTRWESRQKLNLPMDKKLIVYTGHLYSWKGADILAKAANFLPEYLFLFVGGTDKDIGKFKLDYKDNNISILGYRPYSSIPYFLKAADILVLPNSGDSAISRLYTSPMKLFEYMASGTPIIASDLPSIREVLNNANSVLVESDNPRVLALAIKELLTNESVSRKLAERAISDVKKYSWFNRAKSLTSFFEAK